MLDACLPADCVCMFRYLSLQYTQQTLLFDTVSEPSMDLILASSGTVALTSILDILLPAATGKLLQQPIVMLFVGPWAVLGMGFCYITMVT